MILYKNIFMLMSNPLTSCCFLTRDDRFSFYSKEEELAVYMNRSKVNRFPLLGYVKYLLDNLMLLQQQSTRK